MDPQVLLDSAVLAVVLPLGMVLGGWVMSVERRLAQIAAIRDDVLENRADVKDIYRHLLGRDSTN